MKRLKGKVALTLVVTMMGTTVSPNTIGVVQAADNGGKEMRIETASNAWRKDYEYSVSADDLQPNQEKNEESDSLSIASYSNAEYLMSINNLKATINEKGQRVVYASNTDELINAIGSNTEIILEGKTYDINRDENNVSLGQLYIGPVENLTIKGQNGTRIVSDSGSDVVLDIWGCKNLVIENAVIGHDLPKKPHYECDLEIGVINGWYSEITLNNCDIFGCGWMGIEAAGCDLTVNNSKIRDCSSYIADITNSQKKWNADGTFEEIPLTSEIVKDPKCEFNNCQFYGNGYALPFVVALKYVGDEKKIIFNNCVIRDNYNPNFCGDLDHSKVYCEWDEEQGKYIYKDKDGNDTLNPAVVSRTPVLHNCTIVNNAWQEKQEENDQLGWVKFEKGKVGYYISENNQCHLLKSCVRELNYTDENGVIFTGKWKFDENGYAITGIDKGLYYYDKEDGVYPYGMCVPDKEVDEILKEEYDQFHIRPSTVMSRYSFISTYMDDMNYLSYILSAKIDDGWMRLTGYVFQTLRKQRGYVDIDDINVEYVMEESNNRKILAKMMDLKFPGQENTEAKPTPEAVVNAWDEVIDEVEYAEFIAEKIADASKNEKKYSNSFKKLAKEVKKKEDSGENNKKKILEGVGKQSYETFKVIMEQANGWSDALKDCSEKISYLNALEESINKIDSRKVQNIQKLKNAVSELKSNYKKQIKFQVLETSFALIEQANLWDEVVTGEKNPLADWTFTEDPKENPKYNVAKIATDVIKKSVEGGLPLLKTFSQAITTIQTIDGRPEAVNTIAQSQMLYTVAYDVLREKEDKFLIDGNSENLADYLNAFEFMRCITLLRYQNMKAVYASIYNRDNLKQVKVDFLQKEINKLQRISPLNYYENEFSPLTFAGSWDESGEKYYYGTNGDERFYIENRWAYIDGKRYYFDQNGRVLVGAQKIMDETGEGEYYFSTGDGTEHNKDHRGAMQTGPIEINGKEYYYDSNSGVNRGRKVINSRIEIGPKDYRYYGPDGAYDREKSGFSEVTDTDPNHKFYDKGGIRYATNCPVDIIIYDENDNMVGKIVNDQVQNVTDDEIDVYVDSAGQKIVGVPQNGKYKLEIIARAAGTMDYSVAEFASDGSGLIGKTDYRAVTLNQADHFYGITESMFYDGEEHNSYRLLKENTEIELAEYQDTLTSYLINASAEGHGTVEGSKAAIRGDFAKLTAKPDSGYRFVGWYDKDGNCVSKELEFRFRVLEEQNFTAKFTVRGASDSGSDSSDDSDDTSYIPKRGATGKWIKNENGWWYQRIDGTWPHNEWCELDYLGRKEWYYFDKNGYVVSGWLRWKDCYFYLNPVSDGWFGRMETGWKKIDGKWYYFEMVSGQNKGHLLVNTVTPDGYKVDSNGVWLK